MASPTDIEIKVLAKFTERLADVDFRNVEDKQLFLLRFLRARDLNIGKAEEMIRKHMEWRKIHRIDSIMEWEPPEMIKMEFPYEICGFDKDGCPVFAVPFGLWDVRKICESGLKTDYVRYVDQIFIKIVKAMEQSSKVNGKKISQFVCIFIPDGISPFRQMSCVQAVDTVLETVRRFEANHPETLKAAFVIDAPKVFQVIFSVIKPLLNSKTLGKVTISSNSKDWLPVLLEIISADQLPYRLGGTKQSTIPILNRREMEEADNDQMKSFIALSVAPGRQVSVEFDLQNSRTNFSWAFKTDSHDIGFSVLLNETEVVVPYSRNNSSQEVQCGTVLFQKAGKYLMVFDNRFSRWRSKVVRYRVNFEVAAPKENDEEDYNLDNEESPCLQINLNRQMETLSL